MRPPWVVLSLAFRRQLPSLLKPPPPDYASRPFRKLRWLPRYPPSTPSPIFSALHRRPPPPTSSSTTSSSLVSSHFVCAHHRTSFVGKPRVLRRASSESKRPINYPPVFFTVMPIHTGCLLSPQPPHRRPSIRSLCSPT
uniref:Uncharacterized protein n=1 Tax=Arundo donax TaxID=35708 RepID=A0A0A9AIU6_ARUDO